VTKYANKPETTLKHFRVVSVFISVVSARFLDVDRALNSYFMIMIM